MTVEHGSVETIKPTPPLVCPCQTSTWSMSGIAKPRNKCGKQYSTCLRDIRYKLAARRRFYTVTTQNDEKVPAYINRVKQLTARLKSMNVDSDDKEIGMAVLNGLPARFESLIVALDALGSEDKMFSLEFVKTRLLQEEQRAEMKNKTSSSNKDSAFMNCVPSAGSTKRDMQCTNCGRSGHTASHCWGKDINGRCPTPPSSYKSRKNQDRKPAAFVSHEREEKPRVTFESDEGYTCVMAKIEQSAVKSQSASWVVDSAWTAHMPFDRSQFSNYKPMQEPVAVEMGTKANTLRKRQK